MSRSEWTIGEWPGSSAVKLIASVKMKSKGKQHISYFLKFSGDELVEIDSRDAKILVSAKLAQHSVSEIDDEDDEEDQADDDDDDDNDEKLKMLTPVD